MGPGFAPARWPVVLAVATVVVGLVASGVVASANDTARQTQIDDRFASQTADIARGVTDEIARYEAAATALSSFVASSSDPYANPEQFMKPIVGLRSVFPALLGVAYLEAVTSADSWQARDRMTANGVNIDPNAFTKRAEYAFVTYIYPSNSLLPVGTDAFDLQPLIVPLRTAEATDRSVLASLPVALDVDEHGAIVADTGESVTAVEVEDSPSNPVPRAGMDQIAAAVIVKPVRALVDEPVDSGPAPLLGWSMVFIDVAAVIADATNSDTHIAVALSSMGGGEMVASVGTPAADEPTELEVVEILGDDFGLGFAGEEGFSRRATDGQTPLTLFIFGAMITLLMAIGLWFITSSVERRRRVRAIRHIATHDALTDLPNRALLLERLDTMIPSSRRTDEAVAVCCIDIDRFKIVNDTLGHDAGDAVLMEVAARLRALTGPNDVVARLGGDEFAIVAPYRVGGVDGFVDARQLGQLVLAELIRPIQASGGTVKIDVSAGVAVGPVDSRDAEELIQFAQSAVTHAKSIGEVRAVRFDESVRRRVVASRDTEAALVHAVAENQLEAFFQPFFSIEDGRVVAYEALVRWMHPERGLLTPGEFLPDAEANGTIVDIDRWMCRESVRRAALWNRDGYGEVTVWVNASVRSLVQADFAATVRDALDDFGLDASLLGIEVDETVLDIDPEIAARALGPIREMGVRVALDDFGGGSSSLNVLRRFPVDLLKLDRSMIIPLGAGDEPEQLIGTVVGMAHSLGITVIAEGVETMEQRDAVARCGCDLVQGYLYARPASIEDINRTRRRGSAVAESPT